MSNKAKAVITIRFGDGTDHVSLDVYNEFVTHCATTEGNTAVSEAIYSVAVGAVEKYAIILRDERLATEIEAQQLADQTSQREFLQTITDKQMLLNRADELSNEPDTSTPDNHECDPSTGCGLRAVPLDKGDDDENCL